MEQLLRPGDKEVTTPGVDADTKQDVEGDAIELQGEEATAFRAMAAQCNYMSTDRPDLQFAVKEICREMSRPIQYSMRRLRRVACYLKK